MIGVHCHCGGQEFVRGASAALAGAAESPRTPAQGDGKGEGMGEEAVEADEGQEAKEGPVLVAPVVLAVTCPPGVGPGQLLAVRPHLSPCSNFLATAHASSCAGSRGIGLTQEACGR